MGEEAPGQGWCLVSASTFPDFLDALAAGLRTRFDGAGEADTVIFTAPVDPGTQSPKKGVVFLGAFSDSELETLPQGRREDYQVEGVVFATAVGKSTVGGGEAAAKAARDGAKALVDLIEAEVKANPGAGGVQYSHMQTVNWDQGVHQDSGARLCTVAFQIRVRARP